MSLWQEVRSNLGDWTAQAAERGERLARVGMHQVDRYGIHRRLSRQFTELGGEIHALLADGKHPELLEWQKIRAIFARIEALEVELKAKDAEIDTLKQKRPMAGKSAEESRPREDPEPGDSASA